MKFKLNTEVDKIRKRPEKEAKIGESAVWR